MTTRHVVRAVVVLGGLLIFSTSASAQIVFGQPTAQRMSFVYSSWELKPDTGAHTKVTQLWVPLNGFIALKDNWEARYYISNTKSELQLASDTTSLSGFSDFRLQVSKSFSNDRYVLGVAVSLATGKNKLDILTERPVVEALAQSFLEFPLRQYGEGNGLSLIAGTVRDLGGVVIGGSLHYTFKGAYEPYAGFGDYKPGDEFSVMAGGDIQRDHSTWTANVVYTTSKSDQLASRKIFKQSQQIDLQISGQTRQTKFTVDGMVRFLFRGQNDRFDKSTEIVNESLRLYGNEFQAMLSGTMHASGTWSIIPSAAITKIQANDSGSGSSDFVSLGLSVATRLDPRIGLDGGVKYHTGNVDGGSIKLTGFQAVAGFTASW